ncbi:MAG: flavodoxin-dependent (E)-4-hydroxy-3-methylbut-2-enyl-diphosphate synthase [Victivallales bacterium]|nr:flavodoxin-dependent (E)-4-hydroxy-3-methylbut-2-enyl-diphosphate synthase [Victivallales bacterium]
MTRQIHLGSVAIGGDAPIVIQSMCNTKTTDAEGTLAQIRQLADLGCQVIRVALPAFSAMSSLERICAESPLPVVADIHFDARLALEALSAGAHGIRVNPGNLRDTTAIRQLAQEAARLSRCVRIGVNMGSLSPSAQKRYGMSAEAMVQSALEYLKIFEDAGCQNLKVSLKSSDLRISIEAARRFHAISDWPLHLGITEAGTPMAGTIKSAIGLGVLLLEGIGDTIRVSLTAPPKAEITAAHRILEALGLLPGRPQLVSCPTCGRTRIDLIPIAEAVEAEIDRLMSAGKTIALRKIAVMGCEVNGPGEAADADLGIAGGNGTGTVFKFGKPVQHCPENELLPVLLAEIHAAAKLPIRASKSSGKPW